MKKSKTFLVCAMLSGSVLFSSCIGSFGLWNSLKDWMIQDHQGLAVLTEIVLDARLRKQHQLRQD